MLKKLFNLYPPLFSFFLSRVPPRMIEKKGEKFALAVFHQAATRVPAYQQFLKEHKIERNSIKTIKDFKTLPFTEKNNYLKKFSLVELCLDGKIDDKYLIDRSSGYSGQPFYWPRRVEEDQDYPFYMENAYRQFYEIDKKSTLMIITLGLGTWVGGEKISWATRQIAIKGRNRLTVITPGLELEETIEIIKNIARYYEQVVIVGYPPFVKRIIDEGEKQGIEWPKMQVKLGLGGEGYSEQWREYMAQKIGLAENDLLGIAGGYGAADLGMSVGREYPISVLIRKWAARDSSLAQDLFGSSSDLPSFCQYNPGTFFIEEVEKELIFTALPAIPVVRYRIHDRGGILSFSKVIEILADHGYDPFAVLADYGYQKKDIWHLPFFYVWGRADGSVLLYGVVIYVENIKAALAQKELASKATGNFVLKTVFDKEQNPVLQVMIELSSGVKISENLRKEFTTVMTRVLQEQSSEYRRLFQEMGKRVMPQIRLYSYQDPDIFKAQDIKHRYTEL